MHLESPNTIQKSSCSFACKDSDSLRNFRNDYSADSEEPVAREQAVHLVSHSTVARPVILDGFSGAGAQHAE
eukprot:2303006-Amphidinium_carterae.1